MRDITVLMTGCGAPGAPGIIKCFRNNGERNIRLIGVDRNENAGARDLADAFFTVPSAGDEEFIPAVLELCHRRGIQMSDYDIRVQANHWELQQGSRTPRTAVQLVEKLAGQAGENSQTV